MSVLGEVVELAGMIGALKQERDTLKEENEALKRDLTAARQADPMHGLLRQRVAELETEVASLNWKLNREA